MNNLFVYGTLVFGDVMGQVAGYIPSFVRGRLPGFSRHPVKGESYPAIIESEFDAVDGMVYLAVPPEAWERLDRFEGDMYERRTVIVTMENGENTSAFTYVCKDEYRERLDAGLWDPALFFSRDKCRFVAAYPGFNRIQIHS